MNKRLKIAMVTSEAVPYAKTGGLADVAGTLPKELKKLGHEVILILPYYQTVKEKNIAVKTQEGVYKTEGANGIRTYFIANDTYFDRPFLYGTPKGDYPDNAYRFGFFCNAVIELLPKIDFQPDIIHLNDWQTTPISYFLKIKKKQSTFYENTKILVTIHNMAYQGLFSPDVLPGLGIGWDEFVPLGKIEFYGKVNLLKAGLSTADAISTVSKKYSHEIQTEEYGCGLEGVLKEAGGRVYGILNGVDYNEWNPEVDKFIARTYDINNPAGKIECKKDLLKEFGFDEDLSIPVIGMISRLADQKGFDILARSIRELEKLNLRLVLLGTGEEKYHRLFRMINKKYPEHFSAKIEFNNTIAHKISAGCDMFLMPSKYEPCGLNQIYSLKYGTVPIVRATGGLDDTIENFDPEKGTGNGFKFEEYSSGVLIDKIKEALDTYRNKTLWRRLMQNCMAQDFSWEKSAGEYVELYKKMLI